MYFRNCECLFCLYHTASSRNAVRFHRNLRLSCLFALQDHDRSSAIQMAFGICDLVFRAWIAASHCQESSHTVCLYLNLPFILCIRFSLSRKFRHNIRHMLHLFTPPCVFPAKQQCIIRLTLCCMYQRSGDTVWCVRRITGNDTLIAFFN